MIGSLYERKIGQGVPLKKLGAKERELPNCEGSNPSVQA